MTISEAIARVDAVKPNAFSNEAKTQWLNHLEGRLAADVFLLAPAEMRCLQYRWPEDRDTGLLVEEPHDDIYVLYLQAKIDEANGEYLKYQATMDMYNQAFGTFLRWFAGLYDPVQGYIDEDHRHGHRACGWPDGAGYNPSVGYADSSLCTREPYGGLHKGAFGGHGAGHHIGKENEHGAVQQSAVLSDGLWIGREAGLYGQSGRLAAKPEGPEGRQR